MGKACKMEKKISPRNEEKMGKICHGLMLQSAEHHTDTQLSPAGVGERIGRKGTHGLR